MVWPGGNESGEPYRSHATRAATATARPGTASECHRGPRKHETRGEPVGFRFKLRVPLRGAFGLKSFNFMFLI